MVAASPSRPLAPASLVGPDRRARLGGALRFLVRRPLAVAGLAILLFWLAALVAAPAIAAFDPLQQDFANRFAPPGGAHPFGTDKLGRDLLARVLYGGRVSIPIGAMVIALAATAGTALGAVSGFVGGAVDEALMRVTDVFLAFPPIILALAIAAALGPDLRNTMLALVIVWWPVYARMMRGVTRSVKQQDFVAASVALGASEPRVLARTVLPNVYRPLLVLATVDLGSAITAAAALSYLGLGVRPPTPEWGALISLGAESLDHWWLAAFPGAALLSVVMAFNLVGDAVQDALDPAQRSRP